MTEPPPRLLVVAHGTASAEGRATTESLVAAIAAVRPDVLVEHCYLDVAEPTLTDLLDDTPTVAVPLLLSTGYHVRTDIPAAVAGYPRTVVARHLGPDDRLVDVLADRLGPLEAGTTVVLAGAGSSRSEARAELDETAARLARRLDTPVDVLTMADDLPAELGARPRPLAVATYLLATGQFVRTLDAAAQDAVVAAPLGVHPRLVELVWRRYDDAVGLSGRTTQ
jgi:sirohydrochlorin ferrochelatase